MRTALLDLLVIVPGAQHPVESDRQFVRDGQGGHRAQTGGPTLLDVALRERLRASQGARFACGAVRVSHWLQLAAERVIGRPVSLNRGGSLNRKSWCSTGPNTW